MEAEKLVTLVKALDKLGYVVEKVGPGHFEQVVSGTVTRQLEPGCYELTLSEKRKYINAC